MKKYILLLAALAALGTQAQNIYEIEKFSSPDLSGTARFVGMGGAMNALGADLSTIGGNPAATGLYRRSDAAFSFSFLGQPGALSFGNQHQVQASFDQLGVLVAFRTGKARLPFVNLGFNYQKSRNLKQYIGTDWVGLGELSQLHQLADQLQGATGAGPDDYPYFNSLISNGAYDAGLINIDDNGNVSSPATSEGYCLERSHWGGVHQMNFNLSCNIHDRAYLGLTAGIYTVNMGTALYYQELLQGAPDVYHYGVAEDVNIHGSGFDMKFGAIVRPIEENPFRIGFAVHTPRLLGLRQERICQFETGTPIYTNDPVTDELYTGDDERDFTIRTPWRVQLSMATTISNWLALDAEYEFSGTKGTALRRPTRYSYSGPSLLGGNTDYLIADEIDACMRQQHTLRLGVEARFAEQFYARLGYNFVSAPFAKDAFLHLAPALSDTHGTYVEPGTYSATSTDFTNLGATNRLTMGLGWHGKRFYADFAYQLQSQKAETYPFSVPTYNDSDNKLTTVELPTAYASTLVRHGGIFTFGVKF